MGVGLRPGRSGFKSPLSHKWTPLGILPILGTHPIARNPGRLFRVPGGIGRTHFFILERHEYLLVLVELRGAEWDVGVCNGKEPHLQGTESWLQIGGGWDLSRMPSDKPPLLGANSPGGTLRWLLGDRRAASFQPLHVHTDGQVG